MRLPSLVLAAMVLAAGGLSAAPVPAPGKFEPPGLAKGMSLELIRKPRRGRPPKERH